MVLGVDIGGTKLLALAMDDDGSVKGRWRLATGPSFTGERALDALAWLLDAAGPMGAIGVGFPGLVCSRSGVTRSSVILEGWEDLAIQERVQDRFGLPCGVDNDVNNAARAELQVRRAEGKGGEDFLFIAAGTGVGGALVLGGGLWTGVSGLAGEIGHVATGRTVLCACGRTGCVGAVVGSRASARGASDDGFSGREHTLGLKRRDLASTRQAGMCLGSAVADGMNLLNLPLVVLGGGAALAGEPFLRAVDAGFRANALREVADDCRIEFARTGYDAGALGSALLAMKVQDVHTLPTPVLGTSHSHRTNEFRGAV